MNQANDLASEDEMREEYDFSGGVRGKHLERYRQSANLAILDPDVAEVFHDWESVNQALRLLMTIAREDGRPADADAADIIAVARRRLTSAASSRR